MLPFSFWVSFYIYSTAVTSDEHSLPSHLLATARLALNACDDSDGLGLEKAFFFGLFPQHDIRNLSTMRKKRCLDVYRDPIPKNQARKAHTLMVAVRARVSDLLKEWPDHPPLLKVIL